MIPQFWHCLSRIIQRLAKKWSDLLKIHLRIRKQPQKLAFFFGYDHTISFTIVKLEAANSIFCRDRQFYSRKCVPLLKTEIVSHKIVCAKRLKIGNPPNLSFTIQIFLPHCNLICETVQVCHDNEGRYSLKNTPMNLTGCLLSFSLLLVVTLRNRTAEGRGWQNVCVWQTWQGYYLVRVLPWSSLNINGFLSIIKRSV